MHDNARREEELAEYTNRLLAGEAPPPPEDDKALADVVRRLHTVVSPTEKPGPAFRKQLTQRLELEWDLQHRKDTRWWQNRRTRQLLAALAASITLVLAASIALTIYDGEGERSLEGTTAFTPFTSLAVIALVTVGVLSLIAFFRRYR